MSNVFFLKTDSTNLDMLPPPVARKVLFERLFDRLWDLEPKISVDHAFTSTLAEFREVIATGDKTFLSEGAYRLAFDAIVDAGQTGGEQVSVRLLTLFGEIGDVCFESGDRVIDLGVAIMVAAAAEDGGARSIVWKPGKSEDMVEMTAAGLQALRLFGSVSLGVKFRADDLSHPPTDDPKAFGIRLNSAVDTLVRCGARYVQKVAA